MNKEFCQNLKKARLTLGLTQIQLADKLNISSSAISMYEQGRREPNTELLKKICIALNISADKLLNIKIDKLITTIELDETVKHLVDFIKSQDIVTFNKVVLSKDKKSCIISFLEKLIK